MRIRSVTPLWISLPLRKPLKLAGHTIHTADNVLVRIEDTRRHRRLGRSLVRARA